MVLKVVLEMMLKNSAKLNVEKMGSSRKSGACILE